jgi:predicted nucleotidyltransferase
MNPNDPNVALVELVSERLGEPLCTEVVFVGGAIAGLLITDPAQPAIRSTQDVDLLCDVTALSDYHRFETRLRERGFAEDRREGAPICRWRLGELAIDVMPTQEAVLGFSNRWYPLAASSPETHALPSGREIRLIRAPVFVATKLEAFHGRGGGDYLASHDLEDLVAIIDGRDDLLEECRESPAELRAYLADQFTALLATTAFLDALRGHLPGDEAGQRRVPGLTRILQALAGLQRT